MGARKKQNLRVHVVYSKCNEAIKEILVSGLNVPEKKGLLKDLYETYSTIIEQKNRPVISRRTRLFLEKVFTKKQWLTKEERQLIARKCGISPLQVRIWFINKRARSK
ncbi:homeobox domain-containing protein KNAG_0C00795 [Huiozyma naganishii CBS 8797]|uniref:Homeobox domain-containing protein n=1 Tax=Huiozyma naganishii (strain ATCC MYA-139 / BCRC 22969 / CBS 8797 / KCTC 17520 / NBRC 10181 / NCYC 3082 / Yp74L-3) TaxID=1071383 RepID=J7RI23_HUIN7|nr:hypothetical protein KNAG_0C00795 [Kazachstania naganishii CBS 8797]CCK69193.1 hypothetical protein KNAG_0C00795 [Kazachstania naganishii CBS 8797]